MNLLVETVAQLLGKPAAVFLPSGTMCNEIALALHCRPGDEFYCDRTAHPLHAEAGGAAVLAGAQARPLDGERGVYTAEQLSTALSPLSRYAPEPGSYGSSRRPTRPAAPSGGATNQGCDHVARANGLLAHLDGARLFNATVVTGERPSAVAAPFDSAWVDFSKGLGPRWGPLWQVTRTSSTRRGAGSNALAAPCAKRASLPPLPGSALAHHVDRLAEDHVRARRLADALSDMDGIDLDPEKVETNIVIFEVLCQGGATAFLAHLLEKHAVRGSIAGPGRVRFVTHLDIDDDDIDVSVAALREVTNELSSKAPA